MWSKKFWKASATRTVRTGAQVLLGFVVVDVAVWDIDWSQAAGVTVTAMLASVLMSIAGPAGPDKDTGDNGIPDGAIGSMPVYAHRNNDGELELSVDGEDVEYVGKRRLEDRQRDPAWGEIDGEE